LEIVTIFAENNPILLSVRFEKDGPTEFERLFTEWQNPEFLLLFFEANKKDLQDFYNSIGTDQAAIETMKDAKLFETRILRLAERSIKKDSESGLDDLFQDLHNTEPAVELIPQKAYGKNIYRENGSWLRLYAIKLEANCYVVCGGMIKLTKAIQDRKHGEKELLKIKRTIDYLKTEGLIEKESFKE
jgi:hypothetical protein